MSIKRIWQLLNSTATTDNKKCSCVLNNLCVPDTCQHFRGPILPLQDVRWLHMVPTLGGNVYEMFLELDGESSWVIVVGLDPSWLRGLLFPLFSLQWFWNLKMRPQGLGQEQFASWQQQFHWVPGWGTCQKCRGFHHKKSGNTFHFMNGCILALSWCSLKPSCTASVTLIYG